MAVDGHGTLTHYASMSNSSTEVPQWTLGWRLQRSLAHGRMSTEDMAAALEVSRQTISRWQNDHGAPPKRIYLQAWATLTGVDLDWLIGGTPGSGHPKVTSADTLRPANFTPFLRVA